MSGYLGAVGAKKIPGYFRPNEVGSGFGVLARSANWGQVRYQQDSPDYDVQHLPPWGYGRMVNKPIVPPLQPRSVRNYFPVKSGKLLSGLGAVSSAASQAVSAIRSAIYKAMPTRAVPDFTVARSMLGSLSSTTRFALDGLMGEASSAVPALAYDDDAINQVDRILTQLEEIESGAMSEFEQQHGGMSEAEYADYQSAETAKRQQAQADIANEQKTMLQTFATSSAGRAAIDFGAFTSGVTGINRRAIEQASREYESQREGSRTTGMISAGEKARQAVAGALGFLWKYGLYLAGGYVAYKVFK